MNFHRKVIQGLNIDYSESRINRDRDMNLCSNSYANICNPLNNRWLWRRFIVVTVIKCDTMGSFPGRAIGSSRKSCESTRNLLGRSNWSIPAPMPPFAGASRGKPVTHICAEVHLVDCNVVNLSARLMSRRDAARCRVSSGPSLIKISFPTRLWLCRERNNRCCE